MNYAVIIRKKATLNDFEIATIQHLGELAALANSVDETEPFKKINYIFQTFSSFKRSPFVELVPIDGTPKEFNVTYAGSLLATIKEVEVK